MTNRINLLRKLRGTIGRRKLSGEGKAEKEKYKPVLWTNKEKESTRKEKRIKAREGRPTAKGDHRSISAQGQICNSRRNIPPESRQNGGRSRICSCRGQLRGIHCKKQDRLRVKGRRRYGSKPNLLFSKKKNRRQRGNREARRGLEEKGREALLLCLFWPRERPVTRLLMWPKERRDPSSGGEEKKARLSAIATGSGGTCPAGSRKKASKKIPNRAARSPWRVLPKGH